MPIFNKKKKIRKLRISLIIIALFLFFLMAYYSFQINRQNSPNSQLVNFKIETGQSLIEISNNLKAANLIRSPFFFELYAWLSGLNNKLKAGEYKVSANLSLKEILTIITSPKFIEEMNLTIIEGWTLGDMAEYFEKKGIINQKDFMLAAQIKADWWDKYDFLREKPKDVDLEGYLFPDTYRVYKESKLEDILIKLLDNFNKKLDPELRKEIKKQGKTIHEIITMASILEKEVNSYEDKRLVAGIFYNRLNIGMGLQADSTVNYITGKKVARASLDDLNEDSPYNTYKHRGLPPGPISNPGIESIKAAIYPQDSSYLYFLTTKEGQVICSKTFEEHTANKSKYYY